MSHIMGAVTNYAAIKYGYSGSPSWQSIVAELDPNTSNYSSLISSSSLSSLGKSYITSLDSLIMDTTLTFDATNQIYTFCKFKSAVESLESAVIADPSLSTADRAQILQVTSVARYSMYFWMHHSNPSYAVFKTTKKTSLFGRIVARVAADAIFTLGGCPICGAVASVGIGAILSKNGL